jgi:ethanolamine utilization protein EutA
MIAPETLRATVIGAANFSVELSGSTIEYRNYPFPEKNLPVLRIPLEEEGDIPLLAGRTWLLLNRFEIENCRIALAFTGLSCPSLAQVEAIADGILDGLRGISCSVPLVMVMDKDFAKAMGQALKRRINKDRGFVCIDGIHCETGDYIDIGKPVSDGCAVPVIVKTLIFAE